VIVFVTGTEARVGKTLVAAALIRRWRAIGLSAVGMKPVETGCAYGEDHDLGSRDGSVLQIAAEQSVPPLAVCPYRFVPAVSPAIAAEQTGIELSIDDLAAAVYAVARFGDPVVVEGWGGGLSPIASDGLTLDLAERLVAPILLVAPDGDASVSHVLAMLEAARRRALPILGVILSRGSSSSPLIRERGGVTVFPAIPATDDAVPHFAEHKIAEAILDAADRP
jgi:dethiobiotin synthetase